MQVFKFPQRLLFTAATILLLAASGHAAGAENLVTCDELPMQPANGLHVNGVTFYTYGEGGGQGGGSAAPYVASIYGDTGPGIGAYVQDPSIITDNFYQYNTLGMEFDTPTSKLQFGIALSSNATLPEGAVADLYDANENFIATIPISVAPIVGFSEGLFNYSGTPVKWAEVRIDSEADAFAVDNIRFGTFVNRTVGNGEGITSAMRGTRYTATLNVKATTLTQGTGYFYFTASGIEGGVLRATQFTTVMLFGNRAVVTGTGVVAGRGAVRFVAEIVDGGRGPGTDRVTVALNSGGEGSEPIGPATITSGNFRVY